MKTNTICFFIIFFTTIGAWAQKVEVNDRGQAVEGVPVGKRAADQYMNREVVGGGSEERYMSIHLAPYIDSDIHNWGDKDPDNDGIGNIAVTYRFGEWTRSSDLLFRLSGDFVEINGSDTSKLSLMPIFSFPDARSRFPLYFGVGAGLGIFLNQVDDESKLSFDYSVLVGLRFFNIFDSFGLMFEVGLNNHVFLTSKGQFSGTYLALGTVFEF